jgi:hypothetical protein
VFTGTLAKPRTNRKSESLSSLPWPLPHEGFEIEVARWYRQPGQIRCAFYWVYLVRAFPCFEEHEILVFAYRARESVFTKRHSGVSRLFGAAEGVSCVDAGKLPDSLVSLFERTVASARERAKRDEELSSKARDRQEEY